ncbi:MAG TPA: alpha-amylase family glycosyl hydrolase [Leptospiraceae bacterium]|nr:DUF3459 domain-containing protein [Leptospirales bacterium]HMY43865.1 alpha-amylase family glycosyl hydrolase [Leptospiraceae bacterium]HNE21879.1 alpha-amylase family glycosyl hydrolase [Leptospiraceae bacterium]HNL02016.1 alpha-amylase family glycosyl hydrolase [Leptospiraceae bacterium]HNN59316.1 alpha-amylase family glycosyl hydrolase [Leptospiraceae bacterium]
MSRNHWWKTTTIYQVYPLSFQDSNGDGIGDLRGIIHRLDYIASLGFETIWLSPFYISPFRDHGYDVSSYTEVDERMGTDADIQELIDRAHTWKLRVILDMVMNHTSDQHPWFVESKSSLDSPKRNWYIWKKGKGNQPPNNWISMTGKPGWFRDRKTDEWYYANFLEFQPDLNYRNPAVKTEMFEMAKGWLRRGADGFRLDIFNSIYKDDQFRDNPFSLVYFPRPHALDECFFQRKKYNLNLPESVDFARDLRNATDSTGDKLLLGEVSGDDRAIRSFLGNGEDALGLVFNFAAIEYQYNAHFFADILKRNEEHFSDPYLPTLVFGNHDVPRSIGRVHGSIEKWKVLAMLQFSARGVPVSYYGEEIGMTNGDVAVADAQDPIAQANKLIPKFLAHLLGVFLTRDDCRTPMQWDSSPNHGFSTAKPWNPIGKSPERTVAGQERDEHSLLTFYRKLLAVRKSHAALHSGVAEEIKTAGSILSFDRVYGKEKASVYLNFSSISARVKGGAGTVLIATGEVLQHKDEIELGPHSALILAHD